MKVKKLQTLMMHLECFKLLEFDEVETKNRINQS